MYVYGRILDWISNFFATILRPLSNMHLDVRLYDAHLYISTSRFILHLYIKIHITSLHQVHLYDVHLYIKCTSLYAYAYRGGTDVHLYLHQDSCSIYIKISRRCTSRDVHLDETYIRFILLSGLKIVAKKLETVAKKIAKIGDYVDAAKR